MSYNFKNLESAEISEGTRVLLRLDLNLPIVGGKVMGDFRVKRSLPTMEFLKSRGAKTVILAHTDSKETTSLVAVAEYLQRFMEVGFVSDIKDLPERLLALRPGGFLLLENLRTNPGEVENDPEFAKLLASFGDIYVNDAFAVSHRAHASIVGVPKFLPSYAGLLIQEEISHLSKAFNPPHPFVFMLAGDKFETKMPLVKKFLNIADSVFIGGALANDLLKAKGFEIGLSKHSEKDFGFAELVKNPKILLPIDVVVENAGEKITKMADEVSATDNIFDAGPKTVEMLAKNFADAQFVLWNGTLGVYEKGFKEGNDALARALAQVKTESIVGGGDTVASISTQGLLDKFFFVSTGGGAMLDFLANETLPGIIALEESLN